MIKKCANPVCDVEFRCSREGQLFRTKSGTRQGPCRDVPAVSAKRNLGLQPFTSGCVNGVLRPIHFPFTVSRV